MTIALREKIVAEAQWGVSNESAIHYAQTRPIPLGAWKVHHTPITTDCSGFVTCCYYRAGAPNPNGYEGTYNPDQPMWTGTLLAAGESVPISSALPGDLIVFGAVLHTEHVALVVESGMDPLLASHGVEAGPVLVRLSVEKTFHRGQAVTAVRSLPVVSATPMWVVTAGDGTVLASKVQRPALWAMSHWKVFRSRGVVSFRRHP